MIPQQLRSRLSSSVVQPGYATVVRNCPSGASAPAKSRFLRRVDTMSACNRREFLADVGRGMLVASVGASVAHDLGLSAAWAAEGAETLSFGSREPLVALLQETPVKQLLPRLVQTMRA